jgi:fluoroquinolone resistance protein
MEKKYIEDQTFAQIDFTRRPPEQAQYEQCRFEYCQLAGINLSGLHFIDCSFIGCDLSNALLGKTAFNGVVFEGCKLLGLRFDHCHDVFFTVDFRDCKLYGSSFYQRKLKQTRFAHCHLQAVDFTEADANGLVFAHCDLAEAVFDGTQLEKADFTTAVNYTIHPSKNGIRRAKFAQAGLAGLLRQYEIEVVG